MTKNLLLIIPGILVLHSVVLSLHLFYSGPSHYDSRGLSAILPQLCSLLVAAFLAYRVKAKYWGVSIVALALAGIPRALVATHPAHIYLLIVMTLVLDAVSATTLFVAFRYDKFGLSLWEGSHASWSSYLLKFVVLLVVLAGIIWYFGRG